MQGKLFIVGTPIGNLKDITLRAIETLQNVDVILCEDTRVSAKLLNHYEIKNKKLISYHNFNESKVSDYIIELISQGKNIALISDAGMPRISDPGFAILNKASESEIEVEVIPGPTAFVSSFVLSGFNAPFTFLGFLKDKTSQRQNELKSLKPGVYVIYVSPHKLSYTLEDMKNIFNDQIEIFLSKEITKTFEKHFKGTPQEVLEQLGDNIKGEYTMCFEIKGEEVKKEKINKYAHFSKVDK